MMFVKYWEMKCMAIMVQELGGENAQCVVGRFLSCMGCIKGHLEHGNLKGCTHTGKQPRELTQQITAPTMQNKMEYNNYSIQKKKRQKKEKHNKWKKMWQTENKKNGNKLELNIPAIILNVNGLNT